VLLWTTLFRVKLGPAVTESLAKASVDVVWVVVVVAAAASDAVLLWVLVVVVSVVVGDDESNVSAPLASRAAAQAPRSMLSGQQVVSELLSWAQ